MDIELVSLSEDMVNACASDMKGDNFSCGFKASESDGQGACGGFGLFTFLFEDKLVEGGTGVSILINPHNGNGVGIGLY